MVRQMVVCAAVVALGMVLGASVYNSVVDARNWGGNIPESLQTAKRYFGVADPGNFFRTASPLAQMFAIAALVVCWRVPGARTFAAVALAGAVFADVLTFAYFYPRNAIMFGDLRDVGAAARAWREWSMMNHVRNTFVLGAVVAELMALMRVAQHAVGR